MVIYNVYFYICWYSASYFIFAFFFSYLIGVPSNWVRVWNSSSPITCLGYPCIILIVAVTQYIHLYFRIIDSIWILYSSKFTLIFHNFKTQLQYSDL